MIRRFESGRWTDVPLDQYKNEPGTWMEVTRQVLYSSERSRFETRYFEIAPGGYSSFERHQHEHCVIVLQGQGEVRLGDDWFSLKQHDVVQVESGMAHQFRNAGSSPFGILCIVDRERDRPVHLVDFQASESAPESPLDTAPPSEASKSL